MNRFSRPPPSTTRPFLHSQSSGFERPAANRAPAAACRFLHRRAIGCSASAKNDGHGLRQNYSWPWSEIGSCVAAHYHSALRKIVRRVYPAHESLVKGLILGTKAEIPPIPVSTARYILAFHDCEMARCLRMSSRREVCTNWF